MQQATGVPTYRDSDDLVRQIALEDSTTEQERRLVKFYVFARFKPDTDEFFRKYVGGGNDGGIDYYHAEDTTFYIFQSKFTGKPANQDEQEVVHELDKIVNTIVGQNPNDRARDFIDSLRSNLVNPKAVLNVVWLTTNIAPQDLRDSVEARVEGIRKDRKWEIGVKVLFIDKHTLDGVIYDVAHGYVPYTGERSLMIQQANGVYQFIESEGIETGIYSVICTISLDEMLGWFQDSDAIEKFLQKNIRGFEGDTKINTGIQRSYADSPEWFWYKHNGLIIFADSIKVDKSSWRIVMRNPQIVNGGQTIRAAYREFSKRGKENDNAKVILRAYQLPYEDTESYKKSVDIIGALNSQNKILASDLHVADPMQVRLESLFMTLGYKYLRKRSKAPKGRGRKPITEIPMRNIGLLYYICEKGAPHEGPRGEVEEIFSDPKKYSTAFPEADIFDEPNKSHIVLKYLTVWRLYDKVKAVRNDLTTERDYLPSEFTRFFVLSSAYYTIMDWKKSSFKLKGWERWAEFVESDLLLNGIRAYLRYLYRTSAMILPAERSRELRQSKFRPAKQFYQTKEASEEFKRSVRDRDLRATLDRLYSVFEETA